MKAGTGIPCPPAASITGLFQRRKTQPRQRDGEGSTRKSGALIPVQGHRACLLPSLQTYATLCGSTGKRLTRFALADRESGQGWFKIYRFAWDTLSQITRSEKLRTRALSRVTGCLPGKRNQAMILLTLAWANPDLRRAFTGADEGRNVD